MRGKPIPWNRILAAQMLRLRSFLFQNTRLFTEIRIMTVSSTPGHNPRPGAIRRVFLRVGIPFLAVLLLLGCQGSDPVDPDPIDSTPPKPLTRVLFIGNSLTYSNNLPAVLQALAAAAKVEPFKYEMIAHGGFGLPDHWPRAETHEAISRNEWDVVVLQQGASGFSEGRAYLIEYASRYAKEIRDAKAEPALYSVWPAKGADDYENYFDNVTLSYKMAADEVDGMFFPVGEAWRAAWRRDSTLQFYTSDNLHPTPAGTYLAALVMFQQLYHRSPIGLPNMLEMQAPLFGTVVIPSDEALIMQQAAAEANEKYKRD